MIMICWKKPTPLSMPIICSCSSNIVNEDSSKYSELISVLLLVEQNNELLMKNHQARPIGSTPLSEVNVVTSNEHGKNKQFGCGCRRGYGIGRGFNRGRGRSFGHGRGHNHRKSSNFKRKPHHQKWTKK